MSEREGVRGVLAEHFIMWRELDDIAGPSGEWFCECGAKFGFSDSAIDHAADAVLASPWLRAHDDRIRAESWDEAVRAVANVDPRAIHNPYRQEQP